MTPRRIAILRLSALGDIIHTLPAVALLRARYPPPDTEIAWVVEPPYRELVELTTGVDRVMTVSTKRLRRRKLEPASWRELISDLGSLRRFARGEMTVDFQGLLKSSVIGRISGARLRYGFSRAMIREPLASLWVNRPVAVDTSGHVVEWNLQLAAGAGARLEPPRWSLDRLPGEVTGQLAGLAASEPTLINPGAGWPEKSWGVDRFAELARRLVETGVRPLVIWGPGERDAAGAIAEKSGSDLAPETNLRQLAFLLSKAKVVIAGDTGPLHLAAAFGTPVVGLFGPTDPRRNGPYGQIDRCVETWSTDRLMSSIHVDAVFARVEPLIR